uniref:Uncharacterized protein n=1 Tax=Anguilla anguilla TaxID=7936 RepID=A0A0E9PPL2_ANGAN
MFLHLRFLTHSAKRNRGTLNIGKGF